MIKKTNTRRWLPSLIAVAALIGSVGLCRAQSTIVLSNDSSQSSAFYDGGPAGATYTWQASGGPNGGGCIQGVITNGATTTEFDPAFNVSFQTAQYYRVTFQMMVVSGSGTTGTGGSGGYGNLQASFRDASYSWNGVGYATIYPPAANQWVTYTYSVPSVPGGVAHLQFQLQASAGWSGPVTIDIGDVTVIPVPDPAILAVFTNDTVTANWQNYGLNATYDPTQDAPYYNPVNGAGPTSFTPPGSVEFQASNPSGYQGGQLNLGFNPSLFEWVDFDLYYDGPTPSTSTDFGGFQIFIANGASPYNWVFIGNANFTAGMMGKWTHFHLPCASSGVINAAGFSVQSTPGSTAGATPITWHIDNIQVWNPKTKPLISSFVHNTTPGGEKIFLDADGTANLNDQEGITTPSATNAVTDFFWINQTPAAYSFTLTNFPTPAASFGGSTNNPGPVGAGYDAHIYLCNGDSITAFANDFGYNQTYSGAPYNMVDYLGLDVQNASVTNLTTYTTNNSVITTNISYGLGSGVVAFVNWKTNSPNANATNQIVFNFPNLKSANGTWSLNFSDNTHGSVVAPDGSVNSFTLPDFYNDPNYTANFTPATSMVQYGVFKNGNAGNNSLGNIFTQVLATNTVTAISDNFSGPGLMANNQWQIATYYLDPLNRTLWIPSGTAYWLTWNTTQTGFSVISTTNLTSSWSPAGVTYTYTDATGTNTVAAIPTAILPPGNADFFGLGHN